MSDYSMDEVDVAKSSRLLDSISGWRLTLFIVMAAFNLVGIAALIVIPLGLTRSHSLLVVAFLVAANCVFVLAVSAVSFPLSWKIVFSAVHALACCSALENLDQYLIIMPVATMPIIPLQTTFLLMTGFFLSRIAGQHSANKWTVRDAMILFTAFAILFPWALHIYRAVESTLVHQHIVSSVIRSLGNVMMSLAVIGYYMRHNQQRWRTGLTILVVITLLADFGGINNLTFMPMVLGWLLIFCLPVLRLKYNSGGEILSRRR